MSFKCQFATLDEAYNNSYYEADDRMMLDKIKEGDRLQKERELDLEKLRMKIISDKNKIKEKEQKLIEKNLIIEFKKKNGNFWKHPEFENCYIPIEVKNVPSKDNVNTIGLYINEDGTYTTYTTLVGKKDGNDFTREEYFDKYCIYGEHDKHGNLNYYYIVGGKIKLTNLTNIKELKTNCKSIWKYISGYIKNTIDETE